MHDPKLYRRASLAFLVSAIRNMAKDEETYQVAIEDNPKLTRDMVEQMTVMAGIHALHALGVPSGEISEVAIDLLTGRIHEDVDNSDSMKAYKSGTLPFDIEDLFR